MISFDFTTYQLSYGEEKEKYNREELKTKLKNNPHMSDWLYLDKCISKEEIEEIISLASSIKKNSEIFLVIGIGGSYLGSKAIISSLSPYFNKQNPEIIFAGMDLSSEYLNELLLYISDKNITINVISKSGNTLESNLTFDIILEHMKKKYQESELQDRIIVTTNDSSGYIRELALKEGFKILNVPKEIGGRFSVLTNVGLLPIAISGIDIKEILEGANIAYKDIDHALEYAIIRDIMEKRGLILESFTIYEPKLSFFVEWLKQLFAETQGKNNSGILPIATINTRDLHSLGQYYQEGRPIIFETVLGIKSSSDIKSPNYKLSMKEINDLAITSVSKAHFKRGMPSNIIMLDTLNETTIGYLIYFFEVAASLGAYLKNINPFDQPGVEEYKKLLYEELK